MVYLELKRVSKIYGEKVLFDGIDLQVAQNTKVALVAKNGTGKSTLLRVAAGEDTPEGRGAERYLHRDARLAYLPQEPDFAAGVTVMEAVLNTDNEVVKAVRDYNRALRGEADALAEAAARMDRLRAWDAEARIREVLDKLNVGDVDQKVSSLSGGQRKRVALAKLIIDEPDLVIMDEPTNHLDLDMIEWLEDWLGSPRLTVLMVTHDRYFLERVCDHIIELDGGRVYHYTGSYGDFLEKKNIREETQGAELDKDRKRMKQELEWVRRMPSGRGTKAKSRLTAFSELKAKVSGHRGEAELTLEIKGRRLGSKILEAHNVSKSYGGRLLVDSFSYKFRKGERVGIVGRNGAGKSTLLRLLTKQIEPDGGKVVHGGNTHFGYYTQEGMQLDEDLRVIDAVREVAEYIPMHKGQKLTARGLLERFMFDGKQQQVYVSQLSGGERRRLYLLTVLMENPNFLILDEPTNDLDLMTLGVLEEFLLDFPGCVLIVSHDRFFLDKLADHLFIFEEEGRIRDYNGLYSAYREQVNAPGGGQTNGDTPPDQPKAATLSMEQRKAIRRVEGQIDKLEKRKTKINQQFERGLSMDPEEIAELGRELAEIKDAIEEKELEWMTLVDEETTA